MQIVFIPLYGTQSSSKKTGKKSAVFQGERDLAVRIQLFRPDGREKKRAETAGDGLLERTISRGVSPKSRFLCGRQ